MIQNDLYRLDDPARVIKLARKDMPVRSGIKKSGCCVFYKMVVCLSCCKLWGCKKWSL